MDGYIKLEAVHLARKMFSRRLLAHLQLSVVLSPANKQPPPPPPHIISPQSSTSQVLKAPQFKVVNYCQLWPLSPSLSGLSTQPTASGSSSSSKTKQAKPLPGQLSGEQIISGGLRSRGGGLPSSRHPRCSRGSLKNIN